MLFFDCYNGATTHIAFAVVVGTRVDAISEKGAKREKGEDEKSDDGYRGNNNKKNKNILNESKLGILFKHIHFCVHLFLLAN